MKVTRLSCAPAAALAAALLLCSATVASAADGPSGAPSAPSAPPAAPAASPPPAPPAAAAKAPAKPRSASSRLLAPDRRGVTLTWDANIEGAIGWLPEAGIVTGFGRARAGLSWAIAASAVQPVRFWSLSVFYDFSNLSPATIGIQAESLNLGTGTWTQFGGMYDIKSRSGALMLAGGLSIFGLEVQRRFYDDIGHGQVWALYGKLRIPVSIIALALSR